MNEVIEKIIDLLLKTTGNIEAYLANEKVIAKLDISRLESLIRDSGNIAACLANEKVIAKLDISRLESLIRDSGNIAVCLENGKVIDKLDRASLARLIKTTGNIETYLENEKVIDKLDSLSLASLIEKTRNIEANLAKEKVVDKLEGEDLARLIEKTGDIKAYLAKEKVIDKLDSLSLARLIEKTKDIETYLERLRAKTGNIEANLAEEKVVDKLEGEGLARLIGKTRNIEAYLKTGKVIDKLDSLSLAFLIARTGNIEAYLANEKVIDKLSAKMIVNLIFKKDIPELEIMVDKDIQGGTYSFEKIKRIAEIPEKLTRSNSARLVRIADEIAAEIVPQIYNLDPKKIDDKINSIKKNYETTNLPEFAQNFMVFKKLHPDFLEEMSENREYESDNGNIPSLLAASKIERNHIIFSDLLRIALESNDRNLREYLSTIEEGDKLFNMFKEGKLKIDEQLPKEKRAVLKQYSEILNTLYNQTSKGKRQEEPRKNRKNLEQDLRELENLFESNHIQRSLPDRIAVMFGYWAGIREFAQAKAMMKDGIKEVDKIHRERAKNGDFRVKKGDFVKGIADTQYFPSMLRNGIVAGDYLGGNSKQDYTPLDMDVELIKEDGKIFTASNYTRDATQGKKLGKLMVVIENNGEFIKTREGLETDREAVNMVISDKSKKEYFGNYDEGGINSYGIRTGVGSTNISYIISDRYLDKLGLEIARNGFYIPIVDGEGKILFTPEMYDEFRSKMQGMSYLGVNEFQLDESAKNAGTTKILETVEQNKKQVSEKRKKILETLNEAIKDCGLEMTDKRKLDLTEGFIEVIDTGATGRGTNELGDGDFDFIVRIDRKQKENKQEIITKIKSTLEKIAMPNEAGITGEGNLRYKGVTIQGLEETVDVDLTFSERTDELEYTTEECIIDRLETIKKHNLEDYKYVIANIILAKKVLKMEGTYKKKSAPAPECGKQDTRGGLGAVGIENWILQNGGSFEKAAKDFLSVAQTCETLEEFQQKYAIWDFGENYQAGDNYPHDNFVYNMDAKGYNKMKKALEDYIQAISTEKTQQSKKKSLGDIVQEDISVLDNTTYMKAVENLLNKMREQSNEKQYEIW